MQGFMLQVCCMCRNTQQCVPKLRVNSCIHQGYKHGGKAKKVLTPELFSDAEKDDGYQR